MSITIHRETRRWIQIHRRIFTFSWRQRTAGIWLLPSALLIVTW